MGSSGRGARKGAREPSPRTHGVKMRRVHHRSATPGQGSCIVTSARLQPLLMGQAIHLRMRPATRMAGRGLPSCEVSMQHLAGRLTRTIYTRACAEPSDEESSPNVGFVVAL